MARAMTQDAVLQEKTVTASPIKRAILAATCLAILGGILVAGLWPFNPRPLNKVKWLTQENGLEFRPDGTIFTEGPINIPPSTTEQISLEVWLQPAIDDTAPILCFYKRQPAEEFRLLQYGDTLLLQKKHGADVAALEIERSLHPGQSIFFTIVANRQQTSVYVNGMLAKTSTHFIVTPGNLSGTLVAGAQPFDYDSWAGQLRGLAIYHRMLTASEAFTHYRNWTGGTSGELDNAVALYRFDEHQGKLAHNAVEAGPNFVIPDAFTVLEKKFLEPPWVEEAFDWEYFQDVAINIAGFIPLGFCVCAFLHTGRIRLRLSAPWAAIIFGATLSLMIEILQFYLPTRDSSLTDVISNTLGTVIGVTFYQPVSRLLLARLKSS